MRQILLLFILTFGHYSMAQEVFRQENLMSCDATGKITLVPVNSPDVSFPASLILGVSMDQDIAETGILSIM